MSWPAVMPTFMLIPMCACSCESAPYSEDRMLTVAISRICQSKLSRSKMSPDRCARRYPLATGTCLPCAT